METVNLRVFGRAIFRQAMWMTLCIASMLSIGNVAYGDDNTIAIKRKGDLHISISNRSGELSAGRNEFCIVFRGARADEAAQVEDVHVEFAQQVGKIRETPKKSIVSESTMGRYCGKVDLGKLYYRPAFFYVIVRYRQNTKKTKSCSFFLDVK